ncbi:MAG: hypothetical protein ACRET7_11365 [Burkholderiales bacterium]
MTDLARVTAIIILPGDTVDEAHRRMIQRGVRAPVARSLTGRVPVGKAIDSDW